MTTKIIRKTLITEADPNDRLTQIKNKHPVNPDQENGNQQPQPQPQNSFGRKRILDKNGQELNIGDVISAPSSTEPSGKKFAKIIDITGTGVKISVDNHEKEIDLKTLSSVCTKEQTNQQQQNNSQQQNKIPNPDDFPKPVGIGEDTPYFDKNNKPILIGSIVKYNNFYYIVNEVFNDQKNNFIGLWLKTEDDKNQMAHADNFKNLEVVAYPNQQQNTQQQQQQNTQSQNTQPQSSGFESVKSEGINAGTVKLNKDGRPINAMAKILREMYVVRNGQKFYILAGRPKKDGSFKQTNMVEISKKDAIHYTERIEQID